MLTIFSIPKPFNGHSNVIQRNAIQSWLKLEPRCEVILCGNDAGTAEAAAEFKVRHIPDVKYNEFSTPLLSSAFQIVQQRASHNLICYVNADIIILNDMMAAVAQVTFPRFLLLGQRWNMDIETPLDFASASCEKQLRARVKEEGKLQPPFGSDYFVFPRQVPWNFPDFAVGRPGWDNWIIYRARALRIPVIDATTDVVVIHQNHNYAHIPKGREVVSFEGPEADKNRTLMGSEDYSFNLRDVTHKLNGRVMVRAIDEACLQYRLRRQPVLHPTASLLARILWKALSGLFYRRRYFPQRFWQNTIYSLTQ